MGNTDSIPVVSQVKSLVQVIGGDEEGALHTQQNFIRTAPVAAQINSLVQYAQGNETEALRIQEEHGQAMLQLAENTPIVGHIVSMVYAARGDHKKAKIVAISKFSSCTTTYNTCKEISSFRGYRKYRGRHDGQPGPFHSGRMHDCMCNSNAFGETRAHVTRILVHLWAVEKFKDNFGTDQSIGPCF